MKNKPLQQFIHATQCYLVSLRMRLFMIRNNYSNMTMQEKNETDIVKYETKLLISKTRLLIDSKTKELKEKMK